MYHFSVLRVARQEGTSIHKAKLFLIHLLMLIAWLINPCLGLILSFFVLLIFAKENNSLMIQTGVLIAITVILYQLVLPMPLDLAVTKAHYLHVQHNSRFAWAYVSKDLLSYTSLNLLSYILPHSPISFYLINVCIVFFSLGYIYFREKNDVTILNFRIPFFFAIFLLVTDFQDSHHYLRQTTALYIFIIALYQQKILKWFLIIISILWHGSTLVFLPALFLERFLKRDKKSLIVWLSAIVVVLVLSQINIYNIFASTTFVPRNWTTFTFLDRFTIYFNDPRYASYFDLAQDAGENSSFLYLIVTVVLVIYSYVRNQEFNVFLNLSQILVLLAVLFQFHVLIYDRIVYILNVTLMLHLVFQMKRLSHRSSGLISTALLVLCLLKVHFFFIPVDTLLNNQYLYTYSPISIIQLYDFWPINQNDKN